MPHIFSQMILLAMNKSLSDVRAKTETLKGCDGGKGGKLLPRKEWFMSTRKHGINSENVHAWRPPRS